MPIADQPGYAPITRNAIMVDWPAMVHGCRHLHVHGGRGPCSLLAGTPTGLLAAAEGCRLDHGPGCTVHVVWWLAIASLDHLGVRAQPMDFAFRTAIRISISV
jgi:hypothetical protein